VVLNADQIGDKAPGWRRLDYVLHLLGLAVALVILLSLTIMAVTDDSGFIDRDWIAFDTAADRLTSGELDQIYSGFEVDKLPYLYPPYTLVLSLPLAPLPPRASFLFSASLVLVTVMASLRVLSLCRPAPAGEHLAIGSAVFASGAVITATLTGQYSGLYLLSLSAGVFFWTKDQRFRSGGAMALLFIKPNIGVVALVCLLWSRSRAAAAGLGATVVGMAAASMVLGPEIWGDFFTTLVDTARLNEGENAFVDLQVTVLASLRILIGGGSLSVAVWAVWLMVTAVLGLAVLSVWRRPEQARSPLRLFGTMALFALAANPRLYFYDAVLLVLPVVARYVDRETYGSILHRRLSAVLAIIALGSTWGIAAGLNPLLAAVGPASAAWLVVEADDMRRVRTLVATTAESHAEV